VTTTRPVPENDVDVLIVEDSATQAQRLEYILQQRGYRVRHAPDGRAALEMVQQWKPHVVVSDVVMPEMDGYELCRRIKTDPDTADIPVILVTTLSDPADVIRGLECRADNFILKPYDEQYLLSRLQFILLNRQMRKVEQSGLAVEIFFQGRTHVITADRLQILNLLLSTYEVAIQRNRELTRAEEETRLARREAERANRAKSEFLSRMSHDLRTPLNAMLGFAQLIQLDATTADMRENASQIIKAGAHLLEMINEVLDIARIESGHLSLSLEPVPIDEVVQHAVDMVRPLASGRNIDLEVRSSAARDIHATADRQRLSQILLNLLSNGIKYNRPDGRVTVLYEATADSRVRIAVADTGAGIPADKIPLLFKPFERLGAEETGVEGTGLGLALSKALTEAMGGSLSLDTQVDRGSTFWIELPLAGEGVAARTVAADRDSPVAANAGIAGTVLYIEDNSSNRRLMERVFARRPGVRLVSVSQGQAGIDLARTTAPGLIFLDLHLPDMNGEEVLRRLWEDPATRNIPVAVLSADALPSQIKRLLASGATAYLTKPLDIGEVLRVVDRTCSQDSSPVSATHPPEGP
jgi:signal transduction histidine kinase